MSQITSIAATKLKQLLVDSATLQPHQLINCPAGKKLSISTLKPATAGHVEVFFEPAINVRLNGVDRAWSSAFIFAKHWELPAIEQAKAKPIATAHAPIPADRMLFFGEWQQAYDIWAESEGTATPVPAVIESGPTIQVLQRTLLKTEPIQSKDLLPHQLRSIEPGSLQAIVVGAKSGHAQIKLPDGQLVWIFNAHFSGQESKAGMNASNAGRAFCVDAGKLRDAIATLSFPNIPAAELDLFCKSFIELAPKYTIVKREHVVHFLAQCFHESGGLAYLEELASGADYDDRCDLGNCEPEAIAAAKKAGISVGRFYKGHGLIQVTGFTNHAEYGKAAGIDAIGNPLLVAQYPHALGAALFFWASRGPSLSVDAELGVNPEICRRITKVVNGGSNGIADRLHYMREFDRVL